MEVLRLVGRHGDLLAQDDTFKVTDSDSLAGCTVMECGKLEGDRRLCRNLHLLVAGERRARRAGARADQTADQRALAAAGDTTDQRTCAGSASDRDGRALALTLYDLGVGRSLDRAPALRRC